MRFLEWKFIFFCVNHMAFSNSVSWGISNATRQQIFPNIIMRPISSSCWKTIYQEICAYLVLVIICFFENGVLVACDLNFRLCRTFCNNISLTFHPMQDSAIFCTFFPVSVINCRKYFETLAELSSGVKIGSIRAMEFVHNHSISLCASKRRSPKKWKQIKSFSTQSRFLTKNTCFFF